MDDRIYKIRFLTILKSTKVVFVLQCMQREQIEDGHEAPKKPSKDKNELCTGCLTKQNSSKTALKIVFDLRYNLLHLFVNFIL